MFNYPRQKVHSFEKYPNEELQFAIQERRGKPFADIRVFLIDSDGSKLSTNQGLFMPVEKLRDLKEGVERLIQAVESKSI